MKTAFRLTIAGSDPAVCLRLRTACAARLLPLVLLCTLALPAQTMTVSSTSICHSRE